MNFGKAIRVARSISGISQKELARRAKLDPSLISLLEGGARKPTDGALSGISSALKIPLSLLRLLGAEQSDLKDISEKKFAALAMEIAALVLQNEPPTQPDRRRSRSRKIINSLRK